jgi:hypothetical protein
MVGSNLKAGCAAYDLFMWVPGVSTGSLTAPGGLTQKFSLDSGNDRLAFTFGVL